MQSQKSPASARLLRFLTKTSGGGEADPFVQALGEEFHADVVSLQTLSLDRHLVAVAWYSRSPELRAAIDQAARDGDLDWTSDIPDTLNSPTPAQAFGAESAGGSPFRDLPADAWVEHLALSDGSRKLRGMLTMVGAPSIGCPQLSDEERRVLSYACGLALTAATQARRASQLEQQLDFLTKMSRGLGSRKTIFERLKATVAAAQSATDFDSIQLLTWDPTGHKLVLDVLYIRGVGFVPDTTWDNMTREEIQASSKRFLEDPSPMVIGDPASLATVPAQHRRWMMSNGINFLVFVPLIFEGEHLGTLVITSRFSKERTEDRIRSFTALGGHLAAILQLSLLLAEVEESYRRLRLSHRTTIETLALAAEMRDATTGRHLRQLKRLSVAVGRRLGLPAEELKNLAFGAVVHDIGKLHVPDSVLLKRGMLSDQERSVMRKHPASGERILIQSEVPEPVRQIVRWHHERWDGQGYPDGLAGNAIPLAVQIVTVADVFDALVSRRPYKEAWSFERALEEIRRSRGTQLSPLAVDAFLDVIPGIWLNQKLRKAA